MRKTEGAVTTTYAYDRTDQLVSQDNGVVTSFTHDPYGNLTAKAESASTLTAMTYDAAGRLTAITPASGTSAVFTLDALGRHRTRVLSAGGTDTYAYLGSSETVHEISNSATGTTRSLLDIDGSRLAVKAGAGAASFTLFDHLGSLIGLVDGTRTITGATRYDGYGETVGTFGTTTGPWRFRGTLDLSPTGDPLYDMGARYYAPSLGAFTQADTYAGSAANPASMNRFLYAEANPATLIDPTGHYAQGQLCPYGPGECGTWKPQHYTTASKKKTGGGSGTTSGPAYPLTAPRPTSPVAVDLASGVAKTSPSGANVNDTRRFATCAWYVGESVPCAQEVDAIGQSALLTAGFVLTAAAAAVVLPEIIATAGAGYAIGGVTGAGMGVAPQLQNVGAAINDYLAFGSAAPISARVPIAGFVPAGAALDPVAAQGHVIIRTFAGATDEEVAAFRAYVTGAEDARLAGALSPTGRVSTTISQCSTTADLISSGFGNEAATARNGVRGQQCTGTDRGATRRVLLIRLTPT